MGNCKNDFDCLRGQFCATDKLLCVDNGQQKFGEHCIRNGECIKTTNRPALKCLDNLCGTMGEVGDYCVDFPDCRGNAYCDKSKNRCKQKKNLRNRCKFHAQCQSNICLDMKCRTIGEVGDYCVNFKHCRGNAYCDKKKCEPKKNPGEMCEFHFQCQSSICIESQKESLAQNGINQDFGYGQRRQKHCASIGNLKLHGLLMVLPPLY